MFTEEERILSKRRAVKKYREGKKQLNMDLWPPEHAALKEAAKKEGLSLPAYVMAAHAAYQRERQRERQRGEE